ncbi:Cytochrome P450 CYP3213C, partial [Hyalella azteca]
DIFTAASEITSITLRWLILYMIKHPEIQRKIQAEIDSVVPRDRLPGLDDRPSLSYLEATLYEVERLVSVVPLLVPHCATQDIEVNGFHVPKGTVLMGHAGSCHGDPQVWQRPDEFYPPHFLDENGKFCPKKNGFIPFSIGRRVCPGENLARQTMFLFGSALLQTFMFEAPEGEVLSTQRDPAERMIIIPKPFRVIMRQRS